MMTYALMGLLLAGLVGICLTGARYDVGKTGFMSLEDTNFLRGMWSIIVVLVHVPAAYQNPVQDMLGSFAYVGVTFFFMTSAFGLKYSMAHKKGYMESFWRKRLPPILVPALLVQAYHVALALAQGRSVSFLGIFNIENWVKVLLMYYAFFWLAHRVLSRWIRRESWLDAVLCLLVVAFSLVERLAGIHVTRGWIVEPLGFAYGIVAANRQAWIASWLGKNWPGKLVASGCLGLGLGLAYLKCKPVVFWGDYLLKIVLGMVLLAFVFAILGKIRVGNRASRFLGGISYEIYLLHGTAFGVVMCFLPDGKLDSGLFIWLSLALTVTGSVLVHWISRGLLGRWKSRPG